MSTLAKSDRRVVVTGMGAVAPLGNDVETNWRAILEGKSGAGPITHFDASRMVLLFIIAAVLEGQNMTQKARQ